MTARLLLAAATLALALPGCGGDEPEADVTVVAPEGLPWADRAAGSPDADSPDAAAAGTPDASPDAGGKSGTASSASVEPSAAKPGATAAPLAPAAPSGGKPSGAARPAPSAGGGETERFSGALDDGDETLDDGEFVDTYEIEAAAGQTITVDLAGSGFDTYLILRAPSDEQTDNDDLDGDTARSQIVHEATESGTWTVGVTSYEAGETGAYRLTVRTAGGR